MKRKILCLLTFMLLAMSSDAITDECQAPSCTDEYLGSSDINSTISERCRAYNTFKACVLGVCKDTYPSEFFEKIDKDLEKQGIVCNSGGNACFSLAIILGCILFAILV